MKINKIVITLIAILVLASALRLFRLNSVPPHLTPDEASLGYNAYSILKTGRDEYGVRLPIIFKSFGDYKPGLYVYTTVPFIASLGLNEWSVRLPSAVAGIIAVYLVYLIISNLFGRQKRPLALLCAAALALSPWHIHFSRGAWEVNVALTLTLLGVLLFIKGLKRPRLLILSAAAFALTLLMYQGAKLSSSIVVLLLIMTFWTEVKKLPTKLIIISFLVGLLISLPVLTSFTQGQTGRLSVFSVFSYPRTDEYLANFLSESGVVKGSPSYYLFYSENLNFLRGVLGRFFNHFSGRFLFFEGDWSNPRHSAPNHGVLVLFDLPLLIVGIAALLRNHEDKRTRFFILWLVAAVLPSVLSRDQVHAVRSFNMVIPLVVSIALGLYVISLKYKFVLPLIAVGYILSFMYFLDAYFIHLPKHDSKYWEYGYKQIVESVSAEFGGATPIVVQQSYAQPYIYFLFYTKFDPYTYQNSARLTESTSGDVGQVERLSNVSFLPIDWSRLRGDKGSIVIADPLKIPPSDSAEGREFHVRKEIKYLNGLDTAFRVVEIKQ